MLSIGTFNNLTILRDSPHGLFLEATTAEGAQDILLPKKYVTPKMKIGEAVSVFIYTDSEDRLVATTETPLAEVNQFAALTVVGTTSFGAFLDWGLEKDLLLPKKEQLYPVDEGDTVVVRIALDQRTQRLIAVSKLQPFFRKDTSELQEQQATLALVYDTTDLGYKVVLNNQYDSLLFYSNSATELERGDSLTVYVKNIREDGKIDVTAFPAGRNATEQAKLSVLQKLQEAGGHLSLHDKSTAQEVQEQLGMSKKVFKKAVGGLYKERKIQLEGINGIRLTE
ncbi:CvfB family protein [Tunicatimonas pelagia]|uniref:CvfB family protein n=1 Tax=Tunicatimonas pelagia TaxID=931531 RepID=UPI002666CCFD|nr:S1-like domain-containing RNA-binding protein [Tunicatimonas pelagia]WKN43635.1 S1-like domain-containing RNA-binding protein [Tunicatimonas pelagia]